MFPLESKVSRSLTVFAELAHQWFGNLVTMDWWSELWLNEGFATWVGWYAAERLYPGKQYLECAMATANYSISDWQVWSQFIVRRMSRGRRPSELWLTSRQAEGLQTAFQLDSLRASHPIEVPVRDALEVDQIFDHISYLKGSAVIRMLSSHIGVETFLSGVAQYLKKHAYGKY